MKKGNLRWLWLSLVVFVVDLLTKHYFYNHLVAGQPKVLLPFLNFTLMVNTGAAFSLLGGAGGWQEWLFVAIAIIACIFIFVWLFQINRKRNFAAAGLALIFGGALGNLFDRLMHGFVIDFIDFHVGNWHWPVFNLADSAIVIGVIILIIDVVVLEFRGKKSK